MQESICRNEVNSIAQYTGAHIGKEEVREGEEEEGREGGMKGEEGGGGGGEDFSFAHEGILIPLSPFDL